MEKRNIPEVRFKGFSEEWEEEQLGKKFHITMGQSPEGKYYTDDPKDTILVQGNADIKNGKIFPRVWTKQETKISEPDEIILTVRAPVGSVAMNNFRVVLGRGVCSIRGNRFIYQKLIEMYQNNYWVKYSTGSTFDSINSNDIKSAKVNLPNIKEQEKIGQLFASIDKMIEAQRKLIEENKKLKKSLLQKMFPKKGEKLPELRLKGFSEKWEEKRLGKLTIKNNKKNKDLQIKNVESVSNKYGFIKQEEQFDRSVASKDLSNYFVIKPNMFAYNPSRINVGSIGYKREGDDVSVVSPLYISFITKNEIYDLYLWYWLKTRNFTYQRKIYTAGSVRETLSYDSFSEIYLKYPPLSEQEAIGKLFKSLDEKIENEEKKLENYKNLKKSLLQKMFI